jgi:hypothetical protein
MFDLNNDQDTYFHNKCSILNNLMCLIMIMSKICIFELNMFGDMFDIKLSDIMMFDHNYNHLYNVGDTMLLTLLSRRSTLCLLFIMSEIRISV